MSEHRQRTLAELDRWEDTGIDEQHLSLLMRELRHAGNTPLSELTIADLATLVSQKVGLPHVVPIALDRLEVDLFPDGRYYIGDLLEFVLRLDRTFWDTYPQYYDRLRNLLPQAYLKVKTLNRVDREELEPWLRKAASELGIGLFG